MLNSRTDWDGRIFIFQVQEQHIRDKTAYLRINGYRCAQLWFLIGPTANEK